MTHILGTAFSKLVQVHIPYPRNHSILRLYNILWENAIIRQFRQFDVTSSNLETHFLSALRMSLLIERKFRKCGLRPCHAQNKTSAGIAPQPRRHIANGLASHQRVIYRQDDIAFSHTSLSSGHTFIRFVDNHTLQPLVILHQCTNTGIFARNHLSQILRGAFRIVFRIRIQWAHHTL